MTPASLLQEMLTPVLMSHNMHDFLIQTYLSTIHLLYPILDEPHLLFLANVERPTSSPSTAGFVTNIIYAIACYCVPGTRESGSLLPLARACYQRSLRHVKCATADLNPGSLRNMALLALHSLFAPDQGNCTQLLGLASRMCIELGLLDAKEPSLRRLYLSIFCMANQVSLALDRPCPLNLTVSAHPLEP